MMLCLWAIPRRKSSKRNTERLPHRASLLPAQKPADAEYELVPDPLIERDGAASTSARLELRFRRVVPAEPACADAPSGVTRNVLEGRDGVRVWFRDQEARPLQRRALDATIVSAPSRGRRECAVETYRVGPSRSAVTSGRGASAKSLDTERCEIEIRTPAARPGSRSVPTSMRCITLAPPGCQRPRRLRQSAARSNPYTGW
jgi:hypothetical protein